MRALLVVIAAVAVAACAEVARPPGGPVDRTPPTATAASPGSLATSVDARAAISFVLSEKVDRRSAARALTVIPPVELKSPKLDGLGLEYRPREAWPPDTVVVWTLETSLKDKHGVTLEERLTGVFTRGATLPTGRIEGSARVLGGSVEGPPESTIGGADPKPAGGGAAKPSGDLSTLRVNLSLPAPEGQRRRPLWRWANGDAVGRFRLDWLRVPSGPYHLEAFLDGNGDGSRDEREAVATVDSLFLAAGDSTLILDGLELVDLEGPVDLLICVPVETPDSLVVRVFVAPESGSESVAVARLDSTGCVVESVVPGSYRVGAWLDVDGDGRFSPDSLGISEPFATPLNWKALPARPDSLVLGAPLTTSSWAELDTLRLPPVPRDLFSAGTDPP